MDKLIAKLLELLEAEFGTVFGAYYWDRPETQVINRTVFPAIYVFANNTGIQNSGTVRDDWSETVTISAVLNMKDYLGINEADGVNTVDTQLVKWCQESNASYEIIDKSIIGVIRKNIDVDGIVLYSKDIAIDYDGQTVVDKDTLLKWVNVQVTFDSRRIRNT